MNKWDVKLNTWKEIPCRPTRSHVLFCSLYKHNNIHDFQMNFQRFLDTFERFPVSQKVIRMSDKRFQVFSKIFWRLSKDTWSLQRLPRKIQRTMLQSCIINISYTVCCILRYITSCYIINPSLTVATFQYNVSSGSNLSFGVDKLSFLYSPWITLKKRTMLN